MSGMKYLDFKKADEIIKKNPNSVILAGMMEDWCWTSGVIYARGKYCDGGGLYALSRWATPVITFDGTVAECWTRERKESGTGVPDWWGHGETLHSEYELKDEM